MSSLNLKKNKNKKNKKKKKKKTPFKTVRRGKTVRRKVSESE